MNSSVTGERGTRPGKTSERTPLRKTATILSRHDFRRMIAEMIG